MSFSVNDRYGDYGTVGLIMLKVIDKRKKELSLENFMLSCRVFERFIEYKIFDFLLNYLKIKYNILNLQFEQTSKNEKFKKFFDEIGLKKNNKQNSIKKYKINISQTQIKNFKQIKYIKIK